MHYKGEIDDQPMADISELELNSLLPLKEKLEEFLKTNPNPYCIRCGDSIVRVRYQPNGPLLEDLVYRHLSTEKQEHGENNIPEK